MGLLSWFSSDVDDESGKVVKKTEIHEDGEVHVFEYTKPDDIEAGHGHKIYDSIEDFLEDKEPKYDREPDDPESIERKWRGEGFNLTIEDLKMLKEYLSSRQLHTTAELLLRLR